MRFFSKITFICNCCFVVAVILRWVENVTKQNADFSGAIKLQPLKSTLVVLGYGAIFINLLFLIMYILVKFFTKKPVAIHQQTGITARQILPKWLIWINFLFFIVQIYYFFFTS